MKQRLKNVKGSEYFRYPPGECVSMWVINKLRKGSLCIPFFKDGSARKKYFHSILGGGDWP